MKISYLSKIYIYSIIFEPLLLFKLFEQGIVGVGLTIGRFLQILFILLYFIKIIKQKSYFIPRWNSNYIIFSFFLLTIIVSTINGLNIGAYSIENAQVFKLNPNLINHPFIRPFFEIFIYIYYVYYFVILPKHFITSARHVNYFFNRFFLIFTLHLFFGYIDFVLDPFEIDFLPRHFADMRDVGFRFHGFAGEPRDAAVFTIFAISILMLRKVWNNAFNINILILALLSAVFTFSTSFIFGLIFAGILFSFLGSMNKNKTIITISCLIVLLFSTTYIPRIHYAVNAVINGVININISDDYTKLDPLIRSQAQNIVPLFVRLKQPLIESITLSIFGSGMGSSGIVNGKTGIYTTQYQNPNAQITRLYFDNGLVGLTLLILAFYFTVKKYASTQYDFNYISNWLILLIGTFLAHRSATIFIFSGIAIAVLSQKTKINNLQNVTSINKHTYYIDQQGFMIIGKVNKLSRIVIVFVCIIIVYVVEMFIIFKFK